MYKHDEPGLILTYGVRQGIFEIINHEVDSKERFNEIYVMS